MKGKSLAPTRTVARQKQNCTMYGSMTTGGVPSSPSLADRMWWDCQILRARGILVLMMSIRIRFTPATIYLQSLRNGLIPTHPVASWSRVNSVQDGVKTGVHHSMYFNHPVSITNHRILSVSPVQRLSSIRLRLRCVVAT